MKERMDKLDGVLNDLDDSCAFILAAITIYPQGIGFNELLKKIRHHPNAHYKTMAKSTLSEHLQHLQKKNLVKKHILESSNLKLKPSKYQISSDFIKLSKGFLAQSTTPKDLLPHMRSEDVKTITMHLMNTITNHLSECLKTVVQSQENIARYNMYQAFYNLETLITAYRKRIQEKKEEPLALKSIQDWIQRVNDQDSQLFDEHSTL